MTGDKIVACVAIVAMLALVVPRLVNRQIPGRQLLRMVFLWVLIIAVITVVIMTLGLKG